MSMGRCAGCGFQDSSCKKVGIHVMECPDFLELFRTAPERALEPDAEYERWQLEDNTEENRAAAKAKKHAGYRAEADERLAKQQSRWKR